MMGFEPGPFCLTYFSFYSVFQVPALSVVRWWCGWAVYDLLVCVKGSVFGESRCGEKQSENF